jgi:hypothetical protein
MREDETSDRPLIQVGLSIVDPDLCMRYDPEVMAGTARCPEQFRVAFLRHSDGGTVGEHETRGNELIARKTIPTLAQND